LSLRSEICNACPLDNPADKIIEEIFHICLMLSIFAWLWQNVWACGYCSNCITLHRISQNIILHFCQMLTLLTYYTKSEESKNSVSIHELETIILIINYKQISSMFSGARKWEQYQWLCILQQREQQHIHVAVTALPTFHAFLRSLILCY
jgi:hypothetical protein